MPLTKGFHDPKTRAKLAETAWIASDHRLVTPAGIEDDPGIDRVVRAVLPAENTRRLGSWLVEGRDADVGEVESSGKPGLDRARPPCLG